MTVLIIDYGMGNLGSVRRALEDCGAQVMVSDNPGDIAQCDRLVLPGVGAFGEGMANLHQQGWALAIRKAVTQDNIPLLGICLGMHLLATTGHEFGQCAGLDLIPGEVLRLQPASISEQIPHVGWNECHQQMPCVLLNQIPDQRDFYFVHSYHFATQNPTHSVTTTPYGGGFTSMVSNHNHIWGVQFHPEKSAKYGLQLLKNFIHWMPGQVPAPLISQAASAGATPSC